jgi:hypothetical protein
MSVIGDNFSKLGVIQSLVENSPTCWQPTNQILFVPYFWVGDQSRVGHRTELEEPINLNHPLKMSSNKHDTTIGVSWMVLATIYRDEREINE